jgi:hypothetical protein
LFFGRAEQVWKLSIWSNDVSGLRHETELIFGQRFGISGAAPSVEVRICLEESRESLTSDRVDVVKYRGGIPMRDDIVPRSVGMHIVPKVMPRSIGKHVTPKLTPRSVGQHIAPKNA